MACPGLSIRILEEQDPQRQVEGHGLAFLHCLCADLGAAEDYERGRTQGLVDAF